LQILSFISHDESLLKETGHATEVKL